MLITDPIAQNLALDILAAFGAAPTCEDETISFDCGSFGVDIQLDGLTGEISRVRVLCEELRADVAPTINAIRACVKRHGWA